MTHMDYHIHIIMWLHIYPHLFSVQLHLGARMIFEHTYLIMSLSILNPSGASAAFIRTDYWILSVFQAILQSVPP